MHDETSDLDSDLDSGPVTLVGLFRQRAAAFPQREAFVFERFEEEDQQAEVLTYGALDRQAQAIGAWLVEHSEPGDRALLVYPPGLDFIAAFLGCMYAGVLPVPATYPKPRRPLPRLDTIVADCQPRLALTSSQTLDTLCFEKQSDAVRRLSWEATDRLKSSVTDDFQPIGRQPEDLAFLQYTSGSTADPRGVMVSHANLLDNLEAIRTGFVVPTIPATELNPRGVFWLPAYHDMGLIGGILTPLYVGGTSHLMSPASFLRNPLGWLELISRTGAAISGAPNFGYDYCLRKSTPAQRAKLDLSTWRLSFCGAEPIHAATLQEFAEAFEPAGFRRDTFFPCYGLAEATLLVSGSQGPKVLHVDRQSLREKKARQVEPTSSKAQPLVSCGKALGNQELVIVDPDARTQCPESTLGEIWVRGDSVAQGYWNRDELNREVFQAQLQGETEAPFLRTGDLGFLSSGELYITGRLKDMIVIRGRNHFPNDIELTAQAAHEAVDLGVAFALAGDREERLAVVHQVRREHRRADLDAVLQAIRTSIVEQHEIDPYAILLIKPASLPMTSSGKVQRSRCREQYLASELSISAEWTNPASHLPASLNGESLAHRSSVRPSFMDGVRHADTNHVASEVETWLLGWLSERADLPLSAMDPTVSFIELGVDSLTAVELNHEFEQALGLRLPPAVAWDYPTPESLSRYLAEQLTSGDSERRATLP